MDHRFIKKGRTGFENVFYSNLPIEEKIRANSNMATRHDLARLILCFKLLQVTWETVVNGGFEQTKGEAEEVK